jgi:oligogalacturonide transport system substrate-binding protein
MQKRAGTVCITAVLVLTAVCTGCAPDDKGQVIRFSWWGGESRHQATIEAAERFCEKHPGLTVRTEYGAWSGWEDAAAAALYAGTEPDVMQVNWNWLSDFSSDTAGFLDLNTLSQYIDLSQYDKEKLDMCTVGGELRCVPVSETGRVFLWNAGTFAKAGLTPPESFAALCAAGDVFRERLGEDYYPLALGWYDRMLFLVYYLQCRYGREWVSSGTLQYSQSELAEGLQVIGMLEERHVIPPLKAIAGGGADSFDKDENWITGRYAGIYEWDSSTGKFVDALADGQTLTVGSYFTDIGDYHGGFSKIALGFAVTKHAKDPAAAAQLISFLVSDSEAVTLLGTERGIPLNHKAYDICAQAGLLGDISAQAYAQMDAWTEFRIDPAFENAALKGVNGVYEDVFTALSYGDLPVSQGAERLYAGIQAVLAGANP